MGAGAAAGAVRRRLASGPTRPGWTWSEELLAAVSRAVFAITARNFDLLGPGRRTPGPPISRAVRSALTVGTVGLGGVSAERYQPKQPSDGTILRFHGGGFVGGSPQLERRPAAELAMLTNCDTYGLEYRLAPKHPYPAALDDAVTAYTGLLAGGADPRTTILFGSSAGAGLALSVLLRIREGGLPMPAGAVLLWPYADLTFSGSSMQSNAPFDMLPARELVEVWGPAYVGTNDPADPFVSPALAELHGLPPLLVIAGGCECLLSCAEQIAANATAAGVDVQFTVYPDKVHGWMVLPRLPATIAAVSEITNWIGDRIADGAPRDPGIVAV